MKISNILFLAMIGLLAFSSCKKDDDDNGINLEGDWKITSVKYDEDGDGVLDEALEDCDKDDVLTLKGDGTWTSDEGATKCDSADPQTSSGTWSLSADETEFTVTEAGLTTKSDVVELTNTSIMLRDEIEIFGFIIITETTLTKI